MDYTGEADLPEVTDEQLRAALRTSRPYTLVVLRGGPRFEEPGERGEGVTDLIWAHGRRNLALLQAGLMPIVCPVADGGDVKGVAVFTSTPEDVERILSADPAVRAGVLTYEIHPTRSFPGSRLPD